MDRQYLIEHHVVDRYLHGQLSEKELEAFEQYYFEHPEILDELTLSRSMHRGIRANASGLAPEESGIPLLAKLRFFLTTPAWSIGATTAATIFAALLVVRSDWVATESATGVGSVIGEGSLLAYRSATPPTAPTVIVPPAGNTDTDLVVLTVDVADLGQGNLTVDLIKMPGKQKLTSTQLKANLEGLAILALPYRLVSPGQYLLRATNASGAQHDYPFQIVRE